MYLKKDLYPDNIKFSYNPIIIKQSNDKNRKKNIWIDTAQGKYTGGKKSHKESLNSFGD